MWRPGGHAGHMPVTTAGPAMREFSTEPRVAVVADVVTRSRYGTTRAAE